MNLRRGESAKRRQGLFEEDEPVFAQGAYKQAGTQLTGGLELVDQPSLHLVSVAVVLLSTGDRHGAPAAIAGQGGAGVLNGAVQQSVVDAETLAGVLLDAVAGQNAEAKEAWRAKGAAFFQRRGRKGGRTAGGNGDSAGTQPGADPASGSGTASD